MYVYIIYNYIHLIDFVYIHPSMYLTTYLYLSISICFPTHKYLYILHIYIHNNIIIYSYTITYIYMYIYKYYICICVYIYIYIRKIHVEFLYLHWPRFPPPSPGFALVSCVAAPSIDPSAGFVSAFERLQLELQARVVAVAWRHHGVSHEENTHIVRDFIGKTH